MSRQAGRQRQRSRAAPAPEEEGGLQETVVKINRCATVVKGGRRFSFSALVVVGDRNGTVGWGFGKANQVPASVEKGIKDAHKRLMKVPMVGRTIPHDVVGKFGASKVILIPASSGTGVIAGAGVRAVIESAGIHDLLTKAYGSVNPVNLVKATFAALQSLRTKDQAEALRGVKLDVQTK
jgi:small subunit ribosomal protein S5